MGLGIPGNVGQIFRANQADELEQQLVQQQLAQRIKEFEMSQQLQQQRLAQDDRHHRDSIEMQDRQRRDRSNVEGVETMQRDAALQERAAERDRDAGKDRAASNLASLIPLIDRKSAGGRAEMMGQLARIDPKAAAVSMMEPTPEENDARDKDLISHREREQARYAPRTGGTPDYEWVTGADGQPRQIPKGTAKPGDRPYDKSEKKPNEGAGAANAIEHSQMVSKKVDDILPRIGATTAGPIGAVLSNIGGTPAADVSADLNSLAANIAFDQLQKMREASKTGGALGAVSDKETELLSAVVASIRQNQSPENLKKNLGEVKASAQRFLQAVQQSGGIEPMTPARSSSSGEVEYVRGPDGRLVRKQ